MSGNVISLLVIAVGWTVAAGLLKLAAKHCQRGIDAATAMNEASEASIDVSKASIDQSKKDIEAVLAQIRAENDRAEAKRDESYARWVEFCGTQRWADLVDKSRWN